MEYVASAFKLNKFSILSRLIIVFASGILVEVATYTHRRPDTGCVLDVKKDLTLDSPILLNNQKQILFPNAVIGKIYLSVSQQVWFVCSGGSNYFVRPSQPNNVTAIVGRCVNGITFDVGKEMSIRNIKCERLPESIIRKINSSCNGEGNTLAEIGFQADETTFINQATLCFDQERCRPIYIKHDVHPSNELKQKKGNFNFRNTDTHLFDTLGDRPASLYPCDKQKETMAEILGSHAQVAVYNKCPASTSTQLIKGHLSPEADFTFLFQQNATYYFANAAPQWMFFNNRNWNSLEKRVRYQTRGVNRILQVYTGTSEQTTYIPNENGTNVNIFLSPKNKKLPVPLYYWKLLYDPKTREGIGFIGYNVHFDLGPPFFEPPEHDSICEKYLWFRDSQITMEKGLIYCMPVNIFLNVTRLTDFTLKVSGVMKYKTFRTTQLRRSIASASTESFLCLKIVFILILAIY